MAAWTLADAEARTGLTFDTLLADCEGCFAGFLRDFGVASFNTILLEADMGEGSPDCAEACVDRAVQFKIHVSSGRGVRSIVRQLNNLIL